MVVVAVGLLRGAGDAGTSPWMFPGGHRGGTAARRTLVGPLAFGGHSSAHRRSSPMCR
jgi:hypothetical protein